MEHFDNLHFVLLTSTFTLAAVCLHLIHTLKITRLAMHMVVFTLSELCDGKAKLVRRPDGTVMAVAIK
jgi:hypothetical protein